MALHSAGGNIGSSIVIAAAQGIVSTKDRTLLAENGGPILLTQDWALSLLLRMGYTKHKATTKANLTMTEEQFERLEAKS